MSTRFSLGVENERADAGRDGRTILARPNLHSRMGTGKFRFPCSADHKQDWQAYPADICLLKVMTTDTHKMWENDVSNEKKCVTFIADRNLVTYANV